MVKGIVKGCDLLAELLMEITIYRIIFVIPWQANHEILLKIV